MPDHNHLSLIFRPHHVLKIFRQLDEGLHPEKELGRFYRKKPTLKNRQASRLP